MTENKLSATFVFTKTGDSDAIFFNTSIQEDQATIDRAVDRLFKLSRKAGLRKLF